MEFPLTLICCNSQVKWHEICLSTPAAILEVLNAWENGVLSVEAVQVSPTVNLSSCEKNVFLWYLLLVAHAVPVTSLRDYTHTHIYIFVVWLIIKWVWWIRWKLTTAMTSQSLIDVSDFSLLPYSIQVFVSRNVILVRILYSLFLFPYYCQFSLSAEDNWQHQRESVQYGHLCSGLAGGTCQDAGEGRERETSDYDTTACYSAVRGEHSAVLQWTV